MKKRPGERGRVEPWKSPKIRSQHPGKTRWALQARLRFRDCGRGRRIIILVVVIVISRLGDLFPGLPETLQPGYWLSKATIVFSWPGLDGPPRAAGGPYSTRANTLPGGVYVRYLGYGRKCGALRGDHRRVHPSGPVLPR